MGDVSALVCILFQVLMSPSKWFAMFLEHRFFLIMHQVCVMVYLPGLAHDVDEMSHYSPGS